MEVFWGNKVKSSSKRSTQFADVSGFQLLCWVSLFRLKLCLYDVIWLPRPVFSCVCFFFFFRLVSYRFCFVIIFMYWGYPLHLDRSVWNRMFPSSTLFRTCCKYFSHLFTPLNYIWNSTYIIPLMAGFCFILLLFFVSPSLRPLLWLIYRVVLKIKGSSQVLLLNFLIWFCSYFCLICGEDFYTLL